MVRANTDAIEQVKDHFKKKNEIMGIMHSGARFLKGRLALIQD